MNTPDTYYATLGVPEDADASTIRLAYRALSQRHHPDKNLQDLAGAECRMKSINEAYGVLSDPTKREAYDATLRYRSSGPAKSSSEHERAHERPANSRPPQSKTPHTGRAAATPKPAVRRSSRGSQDPIPARADLSISSPGKVLWPYLVAVDFATLALSPRCASEEVFLWQLIAFCVIFFCYRSKPWLGRLVALAVLVFTAVGVNTAALTVVQLVTVIAAVRGARLWAKRNVGEAQSLLMVAKRVVPFLVRFSLAAGLCVTAVVFVMSSSRTAHGPYATTTASPAVPPYTRIPELAGAGTRPTLPSSFDKAGRTHKQQSLTDALLKSQGKPVVAPTRPVNAQQVGTSALTYESMYMRELKKTRARLAQEDAEFEARLEAARQRRLQGLQ